jgi:predicted nicotinamide N-methyase
MKLPFQGEPSQLRPASEGFHCHETLLLQKQADDNDDDEWDDGEIIMNTIGQVVMFQCTLPEKGKFLTFQCLEPSCGVLMEQEESAATEKEEDGAMDPFFFDPGYTLAGKTGFQVWPGSRLLVEALTFPRNHEKPLLLPLVPLVPLVPSDFPPLRNWQQRLAKGARVLELGSGVGVVGASLAAAGAHVLLTDLKTLVQHSTQPNLERNASTTTSTAPPPAWLPSNAVPIGSGWAASTAVDWTIPLDEQLEDAERVMENVEVIIASDCVWLVNMMEPLFETVDCVFRRNPNAKLLLSFQRRDPKDTSTSSSMFTTVDRVLTTMMEQRKWSVHCLAWRPIHQSDPKEVFLFEATPIRS